MSQTARPSTEPASRPGHGTADAPTLEDMSEVTEPTSTPTTTPASPVDEVVRLCRELIRIDSTNYGDGSGPGEREAADYVVARLREVGLEPTVVESDPGRTSVI